MLAVASLAAGQQALLEQSVGEWVVRNRILNAGQLLTERIVREHLRSAQLRTGGRARRGQCGQAGEVQVCAWKESAVFISSIDKIDALRCALSE